MFFSFFMFTQILFVLCLLMFNFFLNKCIEKKKSKICSLYGVARKGFFF